MFVCVPGTSHFVSREYFLMGVGRAKFFAPEFPSPHISLFLVMFPALILATIPGVRIDERSKKVVSRFCLIDSTGGLGCQECEIDATSIQCGSMFLGINHIALHSPSLFDSKVASGKSFISRKRGYCHHFSAC